MAEHLIWKNAGMAIVVSRKPRYQAGSRATTLVFLAAERHVPPVLPMSGSVVTSSSCVPSCQFFLHQAAAGVKIELPASFTTQRYFPDSAQAEIHQNQIQRLQKAADALREKEVAGVCLLPRAPTTAGGTVHFVARSRVKVLSDELCAAEEAAERLAEAVVLTWIYRYARGDRPA